MQLAVDGEAARHLGRLARERWRRATGAVLREPATRVAHDPWPPSLAPDLERTSVAIARTEPAYGARTGVREIERLYADAIASARDSIYIENQYLSSRAIGDALCASVAAPAGPEIVVVSPRECSGWLEEGTMGLLRHRVVRRIREADHAGRFRLLYPRLPGDEVRLNVHAKLMIVDDEQRPRRLRQPQQPLDGLRHRVRRTHRRGGRSRRRARHRRVPRTPAGRAPRDDAGSVEATLARTGSLHATIDALAHGERRLEPLDVEIAEWIDAVVPERLLTDPEAPVKSLAFIEAWTPELLRDPQRRKLMPAVAATFALYWVLRRSGRASQLGALALGTACGVAAVRRWIARPCSEAKEAQCSSQPDS